MQAGTTTVATHDGFEDDRRPARPCGRAVRRPRRRAPQGGWRMARRDLRQAGEIVREIGLGLIDLGHRARRARLPPRQDARRSGRRCDFAVASAGAVVVPIYATNSPEECEWVAGNSEAVAVICEDAVQLAKIVGVRDRLPNLRTLVVDRPRGRHGGRDRARRGPRAGPHPRRGRARGARRRGHARGHVHDHLHVGDDRPAEGLRALPRQLPADARHVRDARRPARRTRRSTSSSPSPTPSRCSSSCCPSTSATRSRTSAGTRTRSSPSCRRSSRPTCRASRGSSRRSTRSSWPPSPRRSRPR